MIHIHDEQEMLAFGERVGAALRGGEVIELIGDVGAGKTTFVRGLSKGLGIDETIQSPSFTISRVYDARNDLRLAHYDFYRLNEAGIMRDELSEAAGDPKTIVVIEWADTVADILSDDRIVITIESPTELSRYVEVRAHGKKSQSVWERVR